MGIVSIFGVAHRRLSALALCSIFSVASPCLTLFGQVNSWTSPVSAKWESANWSLGILPGAGQSVMITNTGWKAVEINWNTTGSYGSSTTNLYSVTISSPANSRNTLLMNYAGSQTPLTTRYLIVSSNAEMTMSSSALYLNGGGGEG